MQNRVVVVMAGGEGTRLYPLSNEKCPKQFVLLDDGQCLFEKTLGRLRRIYAEDDIFVVTQEKYREFMEDYLPRKTQNVIYEPIGNGTAAAVVSAVEKIRSNGQRLRSDDMVITFCPADHDIKGQEYFAADLQRSVDLAREHKTIVMMGVPPKQYSHQYGYMYIMHTDDDPRVTRFIEKPNREQHEDILNSVDDMAVNTGIFSCEISVLRELLEQHVEEYILNADKRYSENFSKLSIDKSLMEKLINVPAVVMGRFQWNDLGSWEALFDYLPKDSDNNIIVGGGVTLFNTTNSFIYNDGSVDDIELRHGDNTCVSASEGQVYIHDRHRNYNPVVVSGYNSMRITPISSTHYDIVVKKI